MDRALNELGASAWLAGLRREQTNTRENLPFVESHDEIFKIFPILDWDGRKIYQYLPKNQLPFHPLEGIGYESLGDWHSSKKISEVEYPEDVRLGRECGLHVDLPKGLEFTV